MSILVTTLTDNSVVETPPSGKVTFFIDLDTHPKLRLDNGTLIDLFGTFAGTLPWSQITLTPTTLAGYGITNAAETAGILGNNQLIVTDGSGKLITNGVTDVEAGYLAGLQSNAQVQIDGKATIGGDSIGGTFSLGTNDANPFDIKTNGNVVGTFGISGRLVMGYPEGSLGASWGHTFASPTTGANDFAFHVGTNGLAQGLFNIYNNGAFEIGHNASTVINFTFDGTNFNFNNGYVGINNPLPTSPLHIKDNGISNADIMIDSQFNQRVLFYNNVSANLWYLHTSSATDQIGFGVSSNNALDFFTITKLGRVGIGSAVPNTSSILDIASTTGGVLMPRMNTTQRDAIGTPAASLMIYNTTTNKYNFWNGAAWTEFSTGAGSLASTLAIGNTSGANNIIMSTTQNIRSANGGGQIDLDYGGAAGTVAISTDNGALTGSWLQLSAGIASQSGLFWNDGGTNTNGWMLMDDVSGLYLSMNGSSIKLTQIGHITGESIILDSPDRIQLFSSELDLQFAGNITESATDFIGTYTNSYGVTAQGSTIDFTTQAIASNINLTTLGVGANINLLTSGVGSNINLTPNATGSVIINGAFQLINGSESAGYLLSSDGAGVATWIDPTTLLVPITLDYIPSGTGTSIQDGTWQFSGNDLLPVTAGSNIGSATNYISTIFLGSELRYASNLIFSEAGVERARFINEKLGIGTVSPLGKLTVAATSGLIFHATGSGAAQFYINFDGQFFSNVTSGTSPSHMLTAGGAVTNTLSINTGTGGTPTFTLSTQGVARSTISAPFGLTKRLQGASQDYGVYGSDNNPYIFFKESTKMVGIGSNTLNARLHIKGSGVTSATRALLVENSSLAETFKVQDDGASFFSSDIEGEGSGLPMMTTTSRVGGVRTHYKAASGYSSTFNFYDGANENAYIFVLPNQYGIRAQTIWLGELANNYKRLTINPAGLVLIGDPGNLTSANARLQVSGVGTTSATNAFLVTDSAFASAFAIRDDRKMVYTDGSQAAGYVLSTNASGVATWVDPSTLVVDIPDITLDYIASGTGTSIQDGTWKFSGNDLLPVTAGSNIGSVTNYVSTIFLGSTLRYAANLIFSEGATERARFQNGNLGIGLTPSSSKLHIQGDTSGNSAYGLRIDSSTIADNFFVRDDGAVSSKNGYWQNGAKVINITNADLNTIVWAGGSGIVTVASGTRNTFVGNNDTGTGTLTSGSYNVLLGDFTTINLTTGNRNIMIGTGQASPSTGSNNILFGSSVADQTISNQIGFNAVTTTAGEVVFGNKNGVNYNSYVFGLGQFSTTAFGTGNTVTFGVTTRQDSDAETDSPAIVSMWRFRGSQGTGTSVGGDIAFAISPAGLTGDTVNPLIDALTIKGNGFIGIGTVNPTTQLEVIGTGNSLARMGGTYPILQYSATDNLQLNADNLGNSRLYGTTSVALISNGYNFAVNINGFAGNYSYNVASSTFNSSIVAGINQFIVNHTGVFGANRIGINVASALSSLHIRGYGVTSSTSSLLIEDSSLNRAFEIKDDRRIYQGGSAFVQASPDSNIYNFYTNTAWFQGGIYVGATLDNHTSNITNGQIRMGKGGEINFYADYGGPGEYSYGGQIFANFTTGVLSVRGGVGGTHLQAGFGSTGVWIGSDGTVGVKMVNGGNHALQVKGISSDSLYYTFRTENLAGTQSFAIRNDLKMVYTDGSQAAGRVLSTDASGVATWVDPSAIVTDIPDITLDYIAKGTGTSITDGTWKFSGNDLLPVTAGSNIGSATNYISTIFLGSTLRYASNLIFSEAGTERARFDGNKLGIGITAPTHRLTIEGASSLLLRTSSIGTPNAATFASDEYQSQLTLDSFFTGQVGSGGSTLSLRNNNITRGEFFANSSTSQAIIQSTGGYWMLIANDGIESIGLGQGGSGIHFNISGIEKAVMTSAGDWGLGYGTPSAKLHVRGNGSTNATKTALFENSGANEFFTLFDDRTFQYSGIAKGEGSTNSFTSIIPEGSASIWYSGVYVSTTNLEPTAYFKGFWSSVTGANGVAGFFTNTTAGVITSIANFNGYGLETTGGIFVNGNNLYVKGAGATSGTDAVTIQNSTGSSYFRLRNDKKLIYTDGSQAAGYVLSTDVNGVATWVDPSALVTDIPDITLDYIASGTGTSIQDGTWKFSGNDLLPVTAGSNIGSATNYIATIFLGSTLRYASNLIFSEAGTERARFDGGGEFLIGANTSINSAKLQVTGNILAGLGAATASDSGAPFHAARTNTGAPDYYSGWQYVFEVGGGVWGIAMDYASSEFRFLSTSSAKFTFGEGTPSSPSNRAVIEMTTGYIGSRELSPLANFHAKGVNQLDSYWGLRIEDSASNPILVSRNDGRVGVGVLNPTAKLHIVGDVKIDGQIVDLSDVNSIDTLSRQLYNTAGNLVFAYENGEGYNGAGNKVIDFNNTRLQVGADVRVNWNGGYLFYQNTNLAYDWGNGIAYASNGTTQQFNHYDSTKLHLRPTGGAVQVGVTTGTFNINGDSAIGSTFSMRSSTATGYVFDVYSASYDRPYFRIRRDNSTDSTVEINGGGINSWNLNGTYRNGFGASYSGDAALISSRHNMQGTGTDAFLGWSDTYNNVIIDSVKNSGYTEPYLEFVGGNGIATTKVGTFRLHTTGNSYVAVATVGTVGNFGIGTSSPSFKLHIVAASNDGMAVSNGTYTTSILPNGTSTLTEINTGNVGFQLSSTDGYFRLNRTTAGAALIYVNGSATSLQLSGAVAGTPHVHITSTGDVGIGTTSPTKKLHIVDGSGLGGFRLQDGNEAVGFVLVCDADGVGIWTNPADISADIPDITLDYIAKGTGTSIADGTWKFSGNDLLPVTAGSNIGSATNYVSTIFLGSTLRYASNLIFSEAGTERARFDGANFGINIAAPLGRFHVNGSAAGTTILGAILDNLGGWTHISTVSGGNGFTFLESGGSTNVLADHRIDFTGGDGGHINVYNNAGVQKIQINGAIGSNHLIVDNDAATGGLEVQANGTLIAYQSVGIGIGIPTAKLHVKGIGTSEATFGFKVTDSTGAMNMAIRDDGFVGIGTVNPGSSYSGFTFKSKPTASFGLWADFLDNDGVAGFTIRKDNDIASGVSLFSGTLGAGFGASIFMDGTSRIISFGGYPYASQVFNFMLNYANATSGERFAITGGNHTIDTGANIFFYGAANSASQNQFEYASIQALKENSTDVDSKAYLMFSTSDNIALVERVRINGDGNIGIGTSNILARSHVFGMSADNINQRLEPVTGVVEDTSGATVNTTDGATATLQSISIPTDSTVLIEAYVTCRKVSGGGVGNIGEGNGYIRAVKATNIGGTVTIGTVQSSFTSEDIAPFNATFDVSGTDVRIRVSGAANDVVKWNTITKTRRVS